MTIQLLPGTGRVAVPWKNGGGLTWPIASSPPGAGIDDFHWRVSLAEVREEGPFSIFAGVDRILTVVEGRLELRFADGTSMVLDESSRPFAFSGERQIYGFPIGGVVRDINVMTRRSSMFADVHRCDQENRLSGDGTKLVVALGTCRLSVAGQTLRLGKFDAVRIDQPAVIIGAILSIILSQTVN